MTTERERRNGAARLRRLERAFGAHPARATGLPRDPDDPEALVHWLGLSLLLDPRGSGVEPALQAGLPGLVGGDPDGVAARLAAAGVKRPEAVAPIFWRLGRSLGPEPGDALRRLGREALDLEALAGSLLRLAPGFGRAAVARFLSPLRDAWPAASELPLDAAAIAAGRHLGALDDWDDPETAAARLGVWLESENDDVPVPVWEAEWWLAALGRRACLRERLDRCPLGADCPARNRSAAPS